MSQWSAAQHCHTDTLFCTIRKSHVTWNFAVPVPHNEEIRRCKLLFLSTLGVMEKPSRRWRGAVQQLADLVWKSLFSCDFRCSRNSESNLFSTDLLTFVLLFSSSGKYLKVEIAIFVSPFTLPVSPFLKSPMWRWNSQWVHTFRAKKFHPLCSESLKWREPCDEWSKTQDKMIKPCPVLLYFSSKKWIKLIPKTFGNWKRDCAWGSSGW